MPPFIPALNAFQQRLYGIPRLQIGLSVDCYSPDIFDLMRRLESRHLRPGYLEVFKATVAAMKAVRTEFPSMPLAYHGEGLWVTQPDFLQRSTLDEEIQEAVSQLGMLGSHWLNHECASKQFAGYSFGTYLPPLYTIESAAIIAENIDEVQRRLDRAQGGIGPLFLLEMPPLTYFGVGTMPIPEFFQHIAHLVSCGFVLDLGHLWTVYRYGGACKTMTLTEFVEDFIDRFPMDRVVEIHIAGLSQHESLDQSSGRDAHPMWIDAHAASIPPVLLDLLELVLEHRQLISLRGVALEVDTKPIDLTVHEYENITRRFRDRIGAIMDDRERNGQASATALDDRCAYDAHVSSEHRGRLSEDYKNYAKVLTGQMTPSGDMWAEVLKDRIGFDCYQSAYLPHEILCWGGELTTMFPDTCRELARSGVPLRSIVNWWFRDAMPSDRSYDFFLLKIERMTQFVIEHAPSLKSIVEREADLMRQAYHDANENIDPAGAATR
ncbi:hypothetical protein W02_19760 [Nitrospira sp. KM1]|uniref:multinuclear nonheme iron-dependent oxidase n=1 Tax=Nitrospira sp. KM1 TaxID=1936990 RepID=UPI0013A7702E|nr:DUF692 family multinuclear iron-containing protein [Nitrospira sp. KM1]BCA54836.1 hypothetical protein W02_19760 [Nitrospira sp. KM1]